MANEAVPGLIRTFIERAERIDAAKIQLDDELKQLFTEAKGQGLDVAVLKSALKVRKKDKAARAEHDALLQLYLDAAELEA